MNVALQMIHLRKYRFYYAFMMILSYLTITLFMCIALCGSIHMILKYIFTKEEQSLLFFYECILLLIASLSVVTIDHSTELFPKCFIYVNISNIYWSDVSDYIDKMGVGILDNELMLRILKHFEPKYREITLHAKVSCLQGRMKNLKLYDKNIIGLIMTY